MSEREPGRPVVVCGAGAAGIAAAIATARAGASVLLVEREAAIGGTVASALIHTLGGLYDSAGQIQNAGLPAELIERLQRADSRTRQRRMGRTFVLQVCPVVYRRVVQAWLVEEPQITPLCGSAVTHIVREGERIVEFEINGQKLRPRAVIDATGSAEVTRLLDPALVCDDGPRSAGGWIFRLSGVQPGALEFPRGIAAVRDVREATAAGHLPPLCGHTWLDIGLSPDEAYVKLLVPLDPQWRMKQQAISREAQAAQDAVVMFLRRRPEFAAAEVTLGGTLGVRDGGRVRGRYTLTADDVRQGREFAASAGRCSWPIEYWDAERGASVEYLPPGVSYEIPLASLQVADADNFWVAGKCLSADRWAHASARVVGACWAMGQAAGRAAAHAGQ